MGYQIIIALLFFLSLYGIGTLFFPHSKGWEKFLTGSSLTIIYLFVLVHTNSLTLPLLSIPFLGSVAGGFFLVRKIETDNLFTTQIKYLFLLLLPLLFVALTPPHRLFDPQYYQLTIPQWYIIKKGFYWDPFFQPSLFAAAGNLLYIPMLAWGSDIGPQLFTLLALFLTIAIFYDFLREFLEEKNMIPLFIFVTTPFIFFLSPFGYNGFIQTLFFAGGVYQLFKLNYSRDKIIPMILAILFLGMGGSTKYQGLITFGFIILWAFILSSDKFKIILIAIFSSLLIAPWYIRNYLVSGNPMWPFLNSLFGLPHPEHIDIVKTTLEGKGHSLIDYPLRILLWNFIKPVRGLQSIAGPLYLALLPWSLFELKNKKVKTAWLILFSFFPFAYVMMGNPRYYMPIHLLMAYLAWHGLKEWQLNFKPAYLIAILTMVAQISIASAEVAKGFSYVFSHRSPEEFLKKNEKSYQLSSCTEYIPRDKPVIVLNWQKLFYLRRLTLAMRGKDEPETWQKLKQLSYKFNTRWVVTPYPFIVTCTPFAPVRDTENFTLWFRGVDRSSPSQETSQ